MSECRSCGTHNPADLGPTTFCAVCKPMPDVLPWVTEFSLRQPAGISNENAIAKALDMAEMLVRSGYNVTLGVTLPDMPVGTVHYGRAEENDSDG